jgi:ketosteroid isomerase-like protein
MVRVRCLAVVLVFATSTLSAQSSGASLIELEKQFGAALDAGDVKKLASFYADDAVDVSPNEPPIRGRAAIETELQNMVASMKKTSQKVVTTREKAEISGDLGYVDGEYLNTGKRANGETVETRGTFLDIWKRINGQWKIVYSGLLRRLRCHVKA